MRVHGLGFRRGAAGDYLDPKSNLVMKRYPFWVKGNPKP